MCAPPGLERDNHLHTLLEGSVNHSLYYYAVGCFAAWGDGFPGPSDTGAVNKAELYVQTYKASLFPVVVYHIHHRS